MRRAGGRYLFFFFQAEDGIRDTSVTGVQTCALPISKRIDGKKTAFFLDGEDILLATEGMTVKKRYKIVRINAESVVIEDTEVKREQTLKISEDAGGAI